MPKEIKSRIIKQGPVAWQDCQWLQPKNFKSITGNAFERLINSIIKNDFVDPLKIWQDLGGAPWILDGHHRKKAFEEINRRAVIDENIPRVPDLLPAVFVDCQDKREAQRLCVLYASVYAEVEEAGAYQLIKELGYDFDAIKEEFQLPGIEWRDNLDLSSFNPGEIDELFDNKNRGEEADPDKVNGVVLKINVPFDEYERIKKISEASGMGHQEIFQKGLGYAAAKSPDTLIEDHWGGMPEFKQEDKTSFHHVAVHFENEEAMTAFSKLVGQGVTEKTHYMWYPEKKSQPCMDKAYE